MIFHVYYMKPEFFRDGIMGYDWLLKCDKLPNVTRLKDTHTYLKTVEAYNLPDLFKKMQGEIWSPNGEAYELIERKGLSHTSMSVGDMAIDSGGNAYFVDRHGWLIYPTAGWLYSDNCKAMKEGWLIADIDGTGELEIQRLDDPSSIGLDGEPRFESDQAAYDFVKTKAAAGSCFHRRAMDVIKTRRTLA